MHVATALITAHADIAAYTEIFSSLEETATFGDKAHQHLALSTADYQQLAARESQAPAAAAGMREIANDTPTNELSLIIACLDFIRYSVQD